MSSFSAADLMLRAAAHLGISPDEVIDRIKL